MMRSGNDVRQQARPQSAALMARLYLDFSNLNSVRPIEYLDHAHSDAVDFDDRDVSLLDARGKVALMPSLVPAAPRRLKQLLIHAATQTLQPGPVQRNRRDQPVLHWGTVLRLATSALRLHVTNVAGNVSVGALRARLAGISFCLPSPIDIRVVEGGKTLA